MPKFYEPTFGYLLRHAGRRSAEAMAENSPELILKTDCQKPSETTNKQGQANNIYLILEPHGQSSRGPVRPLLSEVKLSNLYYTNHMVRVSETQHK